MTSVRYVGAVSGMVFEVRKRTRGNVTTPMVLWASAITVILFMVEARLGSRGGALGVGFGLTAFFGIYLGWRRRSAAVFVAPIVSWLFAWFPLIIAAMVRHGFLRGLFDGLFLVTIGWIAIGFIEFAWLGVVAFFVRMLRGPGRSSGPDVVIFGPDDR